MGKQQRGGGSTGGGRAVTVHPSHRRHRSGGGRTCSSTITPLATEHNKSQLASRTIYVCAYNKHFLFFILDDSKHLTVSAAQRAARRHNTFAAYPVKKRQGKQIPQQRMVGLTGRATAVVKVVLALSRNHLCPVRNGGSNGGRSSSRDL